MLNGHQNNQNNVLATIRENIKNTEHLANHLYLVNADILYLYIIYLSIII